MPEGKTIGEQLADLRLLIQTSFEQSRAASVAVQSARDSAQAAFNSAVEANKHLESIITLLGFSVPAPGRVNGSDGTAAAVTSDDLDTEAVVDTSESKKSCKKLAAPKFDSERDKVIRSLRDQGLSHDKIAKRLGMTRGGVYRALNRGKKHAPATTPSPPSVITLSEIKRNNPNFSLFDLDKVSLSGATEHVIVNLLLSSYPGFTTPAQITEIAGFSDEKVASPTITRLRQRGVAIESAQQARRQGVTVPQTATGWRLIPKD